MSSKPKEGKEKIPEIEVISVGLNEEVAEEIGVQPDVESPSKDPRCCIKLNVRGRNINFGEV